MDGRTNPSFRFKTFTTLARLLIKKLKYIKNFIYFKNFKVHFQYMNFIIHVSIFCLLRNYTTIVDVWLYHILAGMKYCSLQKSNCVLKKLPVLGSET